MKDNRIINIGVRLTYDEKMKLLKICEVEEMNISAVVRMLINREYKKIKEKL